MVTEITMEDILGMGPVEDDGVRILMFYGPTCGPCKATMPHYETVASFFLEKNARIKCFRMNAWEPEEQANFCKQNWKIEGVPTFKVFFRGQEVMEKVGGGDEPTMKQFIQDVIDEVFKRFQERI